LLIPAQRLYEEILKPETRMSTLAGHAYQKMNGLGNQFVILDLRKSEAKISGEAARFIADPKTGPGCDQVITIEERKTADSVFMGVWNADGTEVNACGNAARCVGWILMEEESANNIYLSTGSGKIHAQRVGGDRIAIDMGEPKFHWRDIPLAEQMDDTRFVDVKLGPIDDPVLWGPSAVNVGNPHCIFFVDDAEAQALDRFGPMIEHHPLFPDRVNVSVAQVISDHAVRVRVWERGVGITKACGTAACAALVSAHRRRLTARKAVITLDGGDLAIEWRDDNHIIMTGPFAFDGEGKLPDDTP
jgi:diaminopimelate epimerase